MSIGQRLEQYTLQHPQEVLMVRVEIAGEPDEIAIFRGVSSSLMRPTAYDVEVPILPDDATILTIDRLQGPYNPADPQYLEQGLSWAAFDTVLTQMGL